MNPDHADTGSLRLGVPCHNGHLAMGSLRK
uniref:Uncharacterized protein n=1 Tax=Anguilla anguilla TaxID=7936 RepID=A0A0E9Q5L6_ANGAN